MCTVTIFFKLYDEYPLVVAGNRDEFLNRPSSDPHRWNPGNDERGTSIFAGQDLECGGTWMGVNSHGIVAGVTNVWTGSRDPTKLSRGELVLRCLAQNSLRAIREDLTAGGLYHYNPFNLFCLSTDSGFLLSNACPEPIILELKTGVYVVTNRVLADPDDPKRNWIHSQLLNRPQAPGKLEIFLPTLFAHHGQDDKSQPICIHLPGYGTVSSHLVSISEDLRKSRFLSCSGPPCRNSFQDLSSEFTVLFETHITSSS